MEGLMELSETDICEVVLRRASDPDHKDVAWVMVVRLLDWLSVKYAQDGWAVYWKAARGRYDVP